MLDVRIKVRLRLFGACCPSCNSNNLRPGMIRPWVENIFLRIWLLLSLRRPFLCRDCDSRFYDFRFKARHMISYEREIETILREYLEAPTTTTATTSTPETATQDRTA